MDFRRYGRVALMVAVQVAFIAGPALAASSGIAQLDSSGDAATTWVEWIAGLGSVILIGISIWDYISHGNAKRSATEFVVGIIFGIMAVNADATATALHLKGALLH